MDRKRLLLWAMAFTVIVPGLIGGGYWLWWDQVERYAPITITNPEDVAHIQSLLDRVDYVSPSAQPRFVYTIGYHACVPCRAYQDQEFPKLAAANVEARVIPFALADDGVKKQSTPAERTTVAELWLNRSWPLYTQWYTTSDDLWKAEAFKSADDDMARSGVVWASRQFVEELRPLLSKNRMTKIEYPIIIWRDKNNQLRACSCNNDRSYAFIRRDLGIDGPIEAGVKDLLKLPSKIELPSLGGSASSPADGTEIPAAPPPPASSATANYGPAGN